jgi:hypothetical protein
VRREGAAPRCLLHRRAAGIQPQPLPNTRQPRMHSMCHHVHTTIPLASQPSIKINPVSDCIAAKSLPLHLLLRE